MRDIVGKLYRCIMNANSRFMMQKVPTGMCDVNGFVIIRGHKSKCKSLPIGNKEHNSKPRRKRSSNTDGKNTFSRKAERIEWVGIE
jgi:hypothetical protein